MKLRTYETADTEAIMKLFYDTIHEVNIRDYNQEQIDAWAPADMDISAWMNNLQSKLTYVVENNGEIVGFGQLEASGYIDKFFCHKDFQGQGIATLIMEKIESKARILGIKRLFTEASITAKSFFAKKNFIVVRQQEVELRGQKFINFLMEKTLAE